MIVLVILVLIVYIGICLLLYFNQRTLMYYPVTGNRPGVAQTIRLELPAASLNVWVLNPGHVDAILYFGGNAEFTGLNGPEFTRLFPDHTVYLTDYRGYGQSTGHPTERHLYADALAWYDRVAGQHRSVAVIGRSLGASVGAWLSANRPVSRLVLVTPFSSVVCVARRHYPLLPVRWLLRDRYDSASIASRILVPVLLVMAGHDEVVPRQCSLALLRQLDAPRVQSATLDQAGHNDLSDYAEYANLLRNFLNVSVL
ncbi:MAG: lysophospholipase [Gammaproteobacteria bacterium]|nr:lysophospholipase [Gammaproteobacteria bacterium]